MAKATFKKIKFEEQLQNEINHFLRKEISDSRLTFVSVTKVELNKDYSQAKVYWDTFDMQKRGDAKKALEGVTKKMRSFLASVLNVRHVPALTLVYDAQYEAELKISQLLESEQRKEEEREQES